mgnify:CR=1 FL=1
MDLHKSPPPPNFTNKHINDFIDYIITFNNTNEILNNFPLQNIKGFIFEQLWNIMIKFGFCSNFPNNEYIHKIGNVNNAKLQDLQNLDQYISSSLVYSGNSSGCSDITLYNKITNTYIFISCKYLDDSNSIDNYDVQKIGRAHV